MDSENIVQIFKNTDALLEGHFLLSSGLHSFQYLQCALLLQHTNIAGELCKMLAEKFKARNPSIVIAPAIGGIIVAHEVARALDVRGIFTERVDGMMCLRRGFSLSREDRVLVVEDVITTGRSTKEVIDVVASYGAQVIGVGCIADRSDKNISFGAECRNILKINIPTYHPVECPLCKANIPLVKPGSRKQQ